MSIASEKIKFQSERFLLVRLNPARYILPTFVTPNYEITFPYLINKLERNGIALTKVTTVSNDDEWSQNETTGLVTVRLASAPNDTDNVLCAYYYLFFTGTIFRAINEDPENTATPIRDWEPRIQSYPTIIQSFDNILNGVFTIQDTSLTLINENRNFQPFITDDDSFYNKTVDIWMCINDVSNIKKIFTGAVRKLSFSQNTVTLQCSDSFAKLKSIAYMGDAQGECYLNLDTYPNLDPKFKDRPIPYIVGDFSRYITQVETEPVSGFPLVYRLLEGNEAMCFSYEQPFSTSNNRDWIACRQKNVVSTQSFGSIDDVIDHGNAYYFVKFGSLSNVRVGDTIKYNNGSDHYGEIVFVGDFIYLGNPYNCIINSSTGTFGLGVTITALKSFGLAIVDTSTQQRYPALYELDYSIDDSQVTQGNNRLVKINFVSNFEASVGLGGNLDVNKHKVYYRSSNGSPHTHGEILKEICELAGLPTNAATFTAADTALDVEACFGITNFDEQEYQPYLKYVQDILASTLGYLKINSDFEVEYHLLDAPSSSDVRDNSLMISDSTSCAVEYQDIVTSLIAYNPHNSSDYETSKTLTPSETRDNNKAKFLHGIENTIRFRHALRTITDRIDAQIGLKSMRSVRYRFVTATQDIDTELGDDIEMQNKIIMGSSQTQDLKIVTIEKSPSKVSIEATDLKGI